MRLPRGRKHVPKNGRAREITRAPGKVISARHANGKADHMLKGEYGNESALFSLLRVDANVRHIQEQSPRINYAINEADKRIHILYDEEAILGYRATPGWRVARYTPDAEVEYAVPPHRILEVKPDRHVRDIEVEERQRVGSLFALQRPGGWVFEIVTDLELREGERLHNARILHRYARISVPPEWRLALKESLTTLGPLSARDLGKSLCSELVMASEEHLAAAALALLAHGDFKSSIDLCRERLTADTLLVVRG